MIQKEKAKTTLSAEKTIYEAFKILKENNGEMRYDLLRDKIAKRIEFNKWKKGIYENGLLRWDEILRFYSINTEKTDYIRKNKGVWFLTEKGEKSIELGKEKILENINNGYKQWDKNRKLKNDRNQEINDNLDNNSNIIEQVEQNINIDEIQAKSIKSFTDFSDKLDPYEFQDLCVALLRGMGYYTPFIAPKGKDGGIDITVYKDPLGTSTPRIKIQE